MILRIRPVLAAAGAALLALVPAAPAGAVETTQTVQGRYVRIVSQADWTSAEAMEAQTKVRWDLTISAEAPERGTVRIGMSATGEAPLVADVRLCDRAWQGATCPMGERTLRADWAIPRDDRTVELGTMPADAVSHLRVEVRLAADTAVRGTTRILVHADGFGDRVQTGPAGGLSATGGTVPVPVVVGGSVLVVVAASLVFAGRGRRREGSS